MHSPDSCLLRTAVLRWAMVLVVAGVLVPGGTGAAQEPGEAEVREERSPSRTAFVGDPVLPRGSLLFQFHMGAQSVNRLYRDPENPGADRLGQFLFVPGLGADHAPGLAPAEDRIRALVGGEEEAPRVSLGTTRGRFSANEQTFPMRASYGVLGRVTVGVTVPVVRRRVDTQLRLSPEGANVGLNPGEDPDVELGGFLGASQSALVSLQEAVDEWCAQAGEADPQCQSGRALAQDLGSFLGSLSAAYDEEAFFPLAGSDLGAALAGRWASFRAAAQEWDAEPPETLPLAAQGLGDETFRTQVLAPAWGETGFPGETPRAFLLLGDVEAHVAVSLLRGRAENPGPVRLRSSLVGTVRFPTGDPDSLRIVAPLDPPRGVGGMELKSVTDVLLPGRFAALTIVEVGKAGSRDMRLLAPDPAQPFIPGGTLTPARWSPGDHFRISVTPRFHLHRNLSVGAGWQYLARGPDRYESLDPEGPPIFNPERGPRLHRLDLELRYSVIEPPAADAIRFPLEFLLRSSRTVSGSGPMAPVERRFQLGGRVILRR